MEPPVSSPRDAAHKKAAVAAAKGEEVPASIDTGFYYYDKTNIDDPEIAAVLYD